MKLENTAKDIGVVIPWGKVEGNIQRCLESTLRQTLCPSQILVIGNGEITQPLLWDFAEKYGNSRVEFLFLPGCSNANVARNLGALRLSCTYIAFLDSDDWWDDTHLERSLNELNSSGADFVYSGMRVCRDQNIIEEHHAEDYRHYTNIESYLLHYLPAQTSTYLMRKAALTENLWDCSLRRHQDYEFIARLSQNSVVRCASFIATNVDWSAKRRHKLHQDCFEVLSRWKKRVPFKLYKRHFINLFVSSVRSNDFIWLSKIPSLILILVGWSSKA